MNLNWETYYDPKCDTLPIDSFLSRLGLSRMSGLPGFQPESRSPDSPFIMDVQFCILELLIKSSFP
jgi:hypothetical protein